MWRMVEGSNCQMRKFQEQIRMLDIFWKLVQKDVRKVVRKNKNGKAPGTDGISNEMLKYGDESLTEWVTRVYNVCFMEGRVLKGWQ